MNAECAGTHSRVQRARDPVFGVVHFSAMVMRESDPNAMPPMNPLGMTSAEFLRVAKATSGLSNPLALAAYRRLYREGASGNAACVAGVAPVVRVLEDESPEGKVHKFLQRVPAADAGASDGAKSSSATGAAVSALHASLAAAPSAATPGSTGSSASALRLAQFRELDIESVLIPMIGKTGVRHYTLCVSSQVGCAMNCGFCETAQMGLIRSLTAAEIVGQWFAATHVLKHQVRNMVFMGMGEPLDNYDNLMQAISVLIDHNGAAFPASKITVSTVGRLDGLAKMNAKLNTPGWHRLNLAVSLNAPNDEIRSRIMPINRSMPMAALRDMLTTWPIYGGGKICMEYVLIPGVNDAREHAAELAAYIAPIDAYYATQTKAKTPRVILNLIPYNPRRNSPWPAPEEEKVDEFLGWLRAEGLYAKRRRTKGRAMMGACGQLGSESIRKRRLVGVDGED